MGVGGGNLLGWCWDRFQKFPIPSQSWVFYDFARLGHRGASASSPSWMGLFSLHKVSHVKLYSSGLKSKPVV